MSEHVVSAEMLHRDTRCSIARIALAGSNLWSINHLSTTEYDVRAGQGVMWVGDQEIVLHAGVVVPITPCTIYRDSGLVLMLARSWPPFDTDFVDVVGERK